MMTIMTPIVKRQLGFTLIELMIVTVIIAILVTLALSAYERYTDRVRFSEIILAISAQRTAITLAAELGKFQSLDDIHEATNGLPNKQHRSETDHGIHVHHGVIMAQWRDDGSALDGVRFEMTAQNFVPPIQWEISGSCRNLGYC